MSPKKKTDEIKEETKETKPKVKRKPPVPTYMVVVVVGGIMIPVVGPTTKQKADDAQLKPETYASWMHDYPTRVIQIQGDIPDAKLEIGGFKCECGRLHADGTVQILQSDPVYTVLPGYDVNTLFAKSAEEEKKVTVEEVNAKIVTDFDSTDDGNDDDDDDDGSAQMEESDEGVKGEQTGTETFDPNNIPEPQPETVPVPVIMQTPAPEPVPTPMPVPPMPLATPVFAPPIPVPSNGGMPPIAGPRNGHSGYGYYTADDKWDSTMNGGNPDATQLPVQQLTAAPPLIPGPPPATSPAGGINYTPVDPS